jgi:hypothetical protein
MVIWYSLWSFVIFSPIWYVVNKKNLATLAQELMISFESFSLPTAGSGVGLVDAVVKLPIGCVGEHILRQLQAKSSVFIIPLRVILNFAPSPQGYNSLLGVNCLEE